MRIWSTQTNFTGRRFYFGFRSGMNYACFASG